MQDFYFRNLGRFDDALSDESKSASVGVDEISGVGKSQKKPSCFQHLVTDGIAQVQRLLDAGAQSHHIILDGFSLGGAVATMVASYFHQLKQPMYLWNDRSFASLANTSVNIILSEKPGLFGKLVANVAPGVMRALGWDVDVATAYQAIPNEYKGYVVVAKKSDHSLGDEVVAHDCSLHKAVKVADENTTRYKMFAPNYGVNDGGHNLPRSHLINKEDQSKNAQDAFEAFVMFKR